MKVIRGAQIRFMHSITAGELRSGLRSVPDDADIDVDVDKPTHPTPLDPGGQVTLSAEWEAELEIPDEDADPAEVEVELVAEHRNGRREFLVTLGTRTTITPEVLRQWANRRQEIIWVSALLDGLADAMDGAE